MMRRRRRLVAALAALAALAAVLLGAAVPAGAAPVGWRGQRRGADPPRVEETSEPVAVVLLEGPDAWGGLLPLKADADSGGPQSGEDVSVSGMSGKPSQRPVTYEELFGADDESVSDRELRERRRARLQALKVEATAPPPPPIDYDVPPYRCKEGHTCPRNMSRPVCCRGGEVCCEEICLNDVLPVRCGVSEERLRQAREAYEEGLRQATLDEQLTKREVEQKSQGRVLALQGLTEQKQKSDMTRQEAETKREIARREQEQKRDIQMTHEEARREMSRLASEERLKTPPKLLPMADTLVPLSTSFRPLTFRLIDSLCAVSGRVRVTGTFKARVSTLPMGCRPRARLVFSVQGTGRTPVQVTVDPDGAVVVRSVQRDMTELSLDGILFAVAGTKETDLELMGGWHHRAGGPPDAADGAPTETDAKYMDAGYTALGPVCLLTGLVQVRGSDRMADRPYISELPPHCRPAAHTVVTAPAAAGGHFRLDAFGPSANGDPGGKLYWIGGVQAGQWLSLDGAVLLTEGSKAGWKSLGCNAGFVPLGTPYTLPGYFIFRDALVVLSGVVLSTTPGAGLVLVLPEEARPAARLSFSAQSPTHGSTSNTQRVDVLPNGEVWWVQSTSGSLGPVSEGVFDPSFRPASTMISLDTIRFSVP